MEINKTLHITGQLNPASPPLKSNITIAQKGDKGDKGDKGEPGDVRLEEYITGSILTIAPNVYYTIAPTYTNIQLNMIDKEYGKTNEYAGEITPSETTVLTFNGARWATTGDVVVEYSGSSSILTIEPGSTYQFSIINGIGYCVGVELE